MAAGVHHDGRRLSVFDGWSSECATWQQRWNATRLARLSGHHVPIVAFVHVPKAAGHTVEGALERAFHNQNATQHSSIGDRVHWRGGHHSILEVMTDDMHHRRTPSTFVTVLREPMSGAISQYNDIANSLSVPHFCDNADGTMRTTPSYCGRGFRLFCRAGTGGNTVLRQSEGRNSTTACVPSTPFDEWIRPCAGSRAVHEHVCMPANPTLFFVHPMRLSGVNESTAADDLDAILQRELRHHYLMLATLSRADSVTHMLRRLEWALAPPHPMLEPSRVHLPPEEVQMRTEPAAGSTSPSPPLSTLATVYRPFRLDDLTAAQVRSVRTTVAEGHWLDVALYRAAVSVEAEQRACFDAMLA